MSWQAYVDQSLLGTKQVACAAIHGLDGNPWATSHGFAVSRLTPEWDQDSLSQGEVRFAQVLSREPCEPLPSKDFLEFQPLCAFFWDYFINQDMTGISLSRSWILRSGLSET